MRRFLYWGILGLLACPSVALCDDPVESQRDPAQGKGAASAPPANQGAQAQPPGTEEAKLLSALKEALENNSRELKALKEQYTKDMAEQRTTVEAQRKQIELLQNSARAMEERLKVPAAPNAAGAQPGTGPNSQQLLSELQQKQIRLLQDQVQLLADQAENEAPAVESLETNTATLESRSKQAAQRDKELADAHDALLDAVDAQQRTTPSLPAMIKGMFVPTGSNVSPITIVNTLATRYDLFTHQRGAGVFEFQEFTPFFLVQLNKRVLLSGELTFTPSGVSLGQAQADIFINDWLMMDIGYFLAPIGFWNERLDPEWINKLPDEPLVLRQVIPDGLALTGLQFRGAKYLFGSPVKMEYSVYATNSTGVPGTGQPGWADLGALIGTTANINQGMAYGGRLGFWLPTRGINFGVSEFVNAPYSHPSGAVTSLWQPYFNYHYGNWDFRAEYGQMYQRTTTFLGNSISRTGGYAQLAYRNYQSTHKHLQKLEYVFRYSEARFAGINQAGAAVNVSSFGTPMDAPVDRNQYTIGVNYYLFPVTIFKIAYEINQELHTNLHDNVLFMQFATNF